MQKATTGKRIGAFFIDSLISGIVIALISSLLEDPEFLRQLTAIEEAYLNGSMDFLAYSEALDALVDPNLWIKQLVSLVLSIGYFIVLPLFWKEQTIGRKVTKIKVVQENNQPAKLQHFIIREGIGQLLFISVFGFLVTVTNVTIFETIESILNTILVFVLIVGFFTMLGSSKTTLYDRLSKTLMVLDNTPVANDELDIAQEKVKEEDIIDL